MFGFDTNWEKQQARKDRRNRSPKESRTISGGLSGLYQYKDESGGRHVGLRGSARVDGKIITDKNQYRKTDQFKNASRKEKDQLSRDFNRGVDLNEREQRAVLQQDEDGNLTQKPSTQNFSGTTSERGEMLGYMQQLTDMTNKAQEANSRAARMKAEFIKAETDRAELEKEKDQKQSDEEDNEKGKIRSTGNDDTDESYAIEDNVVAEVNSQNPLVRRSHVNQTIDQEVMQLYSEIETLGGSV